MATREPRKMFKQRMESGELKSIASSRTCNPKRLGSEFQLWNLRLSDPTTTSSGHAQANMGHPFSHQVKHPAVAKIAPEQETNAYSAILRSIALRICWLTLANARPFGASHIFSGTHCKIHSRRTDVGFNEVSICTSFAQKEVF